jgi:hypothetical protein
MAVVRHQVGAVRNTVHRPLAAVHVDDRELAVPGHRHRAPRASMHGAAADR